MVKISEMGVGDGKSTDLFRGVLNGDFWQNGWGASCPGRGLEAGDSSAHSGTCEGPFNSSNDPSAYLWKALNAQMKTLECLHSREPLEVVIRRERHVWSLREIMETVQVEVKTREKMRIWIKNVAAGRKRKRFKSYIGSRIAEFSLCPSHTHTELSPPKLKTGETGNFAILGNNLERTVELTTTLYDELKCTLHENFENWHNGFNRSSLQQWFSALIAHQNDLENNAWGPAQGC